MSPFLPDLRIALRGILRQPLHSTATIATLALAMAGLMAVFALVEAVLLRSLPYREPDRLVALWVDVSQRSESLGLQDPRREWSNFDTLTDLQQGVRNLEGVAGLQGWTPTLSGLGEAVRLQGAVPTWNAFDLLGVQPILGRGFLPEEGEPGGPDTVVLGHGLWQRLFEADPAVLGRRIELNRIGYTVVGVLPPGFRFPFFPEAELYTSNQRRSDDRDSAYLRLFGRLAPGATMERAQQELDGFAAALGERHPAAFAGAGFFLEPLQDALALSLRPALLALQLAAALVLLIAAANLASLAAARSLARGGEFAVRSALGATRARCFQLLFGEALLLALAGWVLAALTARFGLGVFAALFPDGFAQAWLPRVDGPTLLVGAVVALVVALVMAAVAQFTLRTRDTAVAGSAARSLGSRQGGRGAAALVALNFALALAVGVASLLLLDSHARLQRVDLGFDPDGLVAGALLLPSAAYPDDTAIEGAHRRLEAAVRAIPGVQSVALSTAFPLGIGNADTRVQIEGRPGARAHVWLNRISTAFLPTLGLRLREGRDLAATDSGEAGRRVLVNAAFVRAHLDGRAPLGLRIRAGSDPEAPWFEIIGVVEDVRQFDVATPQTPTVYLPMAADPMRGLYLGVRTAADPLALMPALRAAVAAVDPAVALSDLRSMQQRVEASLSLPRAVARISLAFAACGLLLAALGVYATLSHAVQRRQREFGVRRAMGANDANLLRQVLRLALVPIAAGLVLGLPLAALVSLRLQDQLFEVAPWSAGAWIMALALLLCVGLVAALLPGRRALRVSPMTALRAD